MNFGSSRILKFEIELKIQLLGNEKHLLEEYLLTNQSSISYLGGFEQTDYYFDTVPPSFARKDTALRVRVEHDIKNKNDDSCIELTYKGAKINSDSKNKFKVFKHNKKERESITRDTTNLGN